MKEYKKVFLLKYDPKMRRIEQADTKLLGNRKLKMPSVKVVYYDLNNVEWDIRSGKD